jgi:hypothetical protein
MLNSKGVGGPGQAPTFLQKKKEREVEVEESETTNIMME